MTAVTAPSPAMEFLVESLKKDKAAAYADLKAKADAKKLKVFPIMYGRAKAMLGLVKVAKYGTGKFARANAAMAAKGTVKRGRPIGGSSSKSGQVRELLKTGMSAAEIAKKVGCTTGLVYVVKSSSGMAGKRGPGRPRKAAASTSLDGLVAAVRNSERERAQMRTALERIRSVCADALS